MYIAIDGPIGVGKTTLAEKLAGSLGAELVRERVEEKLLRAFYGDKPGAAIDLQYHFLYSRYRQQKSLASRLLRGETVVCDYVFEKNSIFAGINLLPQSFAIYEKYFKHLSREVPSPDVVVYLQGSLASIQRRIRRRGRSYEKKIRTSYLEKVVTAYQEYFFQSPPGKLIVVNTDNINVADIKADVDDLQKMILSTPYGVNYYHPPGSSPDDPDGKAEKE